MLGRENEVPSLRAQLTQAQRHVEQAEKSIEEQILLIERLAADGHNTDAAERLLVTLTEVMEKLTLHRNELEREAETCRHAEPPKA